MGGVNDKLTTGSSGRKDGRDSLDLRSPSEAIRYVEERAKYEDDFDREYHGRDTLHRGSRISMGLVLTTSASRYSTKLVEGKGRKCCGCLERGESLHPAFVEEAKARKSKIVMDLTESERADMSMAIYDDLVSIFWNLVRGACRNLDPRTFEDEVEVGTTVLDTLEDAWQISMNDLKTLARKMPHWVESAKGSVDDPIERALLNRLSQELLEANPRIVSHPYSGGPFHGSTLLMQACANGDEVTVERLLRYADMQFVKDSVVNGFATGAFFTMHIHKVPEQVDNILYFWGFSVLEAAAIGPKDDAVAVRLVKLLIEQGADPAECGNAHWSATLMHRLAVSRWDLLGGALTGGLIETARMNMLIDVLFENAEEKKYDAIRHVATKQQPEFRKSIMRALKRQTTHDHYVRLDKMHSHTKRAASMSSDSEESVDEEVTIERSPLHVAAMVGNDQFIIKYLSYHVKHVWQWGNRREVLIPLFQLDNTHREGTTASVLELLLLHGHRNIIMYEVFIDIISKKWQKFGARLVGLTFLLFFMFIVLATAGCMGSSVVGRSVARGCRVTALTLALLMLGTFSHCSAKTRHLEWFQAMPFTSIVSLDKNMCYDRRLCWSQTNTFRLVWVLWLGVGSILLHELEVYVDLDEQLLNGDRKDFVHSCLVTTDGFTGFFIFGAWMSLLNALRFYQATSLFISILSEIFKDKNIIAWIVVYIVWVVATGAAIRAASWHVPTNGDHVADTFSNMVLTLEESTHGPDVQWRKMVQTKPAICAFFFVFFLWAVTIAMLNLLISVFSGTFVEKRKTALRDMWFNIAVETITYEKYMPEALFHRLKGRIGKPYNCFMNYGSFNRNKLHSQRSSVSSSSARSEVLNLGGERGCLDEEQVSLVSMERGLQQGDWLAFSEKLDSSGRDCGRWSHMRSTNC